ncbi:hypothetical protein [Aquipuribacter hungaricus]|uniref:D-inositol 3-phosphate glycosyltransferase n=1 Tax=Aquipuribacter hungaricus TaxID=545624 RepID=A0ABV7WAQ5_9MICO
MRRPSPSTTPFCHVTWQRHGGRAEEMAYALGGRAVHVYPGALAARRLVLVRYAVSVLLTAAALVRLRPRAVVVVNPPVVPGLVVAAYARLTGARFLLDSHTSSFGVKGNAVAARTLGITRWLGRRSSGVMVTTSSWVAEVQRWGARGLVVHEAPPAWQVAPAVRSERPQVLFVGVFSSDEPVAEVVAAAALLPDVDVLVTGDVDRAPAGMVEAAPSNVVFTGFLDQQAYRARLEQSDVVLALTTEPTSVMRAAYEAVYARRALVVSDWPTLREVFPLARHRGNEAAALADGVREALSDDPAAAADRAEQALSVQAERWDDQLDAMRTALALPVPTPQGA